MEKKKDPQKKTLKNLDDLVKRNRLKSYNLDKLFELREDCQEWAKKLESGGKRVIYEILSEINISKVPQKDGSRGLVIEKKVYLADILPFLEYFMPEERECYITKTNNRSWPYTGNKYIQLMWNIDNEKDLKENFFYVFKNLEVPFHILWISHPISKCNVVKYKDPNLEKNPELEFMLMNDEEGRKKRIEFNQKTFRTNTSDSKSVELIVGKIANGKKRVSKFRITFTLNWKQDKKPIGGVFKINYFQESEIGGCKFSRVTGEIEEEEKRERVQDDLFYEEID